MKTSHDDDLGPDLESSGARAQTSPSENDGDAHGTRSRRETHAGRDGETGAGCHEADASDAARAACAVKKEIEGCKEKITPEIVGTMVCRLVSDPMVEAAKDVLYAYDLINIESRILPAEKNEIIREAIQAALHEEGKIEIA